MTVLETSDFRKGLKIMHNNAPFVIVDFQHVKPGKGNAFTRTKIKNLQSGSVLEVTYRSGEKIEGADCEDKTMTFLYADGSSYHFMDAKTYDQVEIQEETLGDAAKYVLPEMSCAVVFFKGRPLTIEVPNHVELKVTHCEPGVRGDTATNVTKPATMETGVQVNVPLFISVGDTVKIDTSNGAYLERTGRA